MAEKLSWDEILKKYDQQWIELVDFDWDETDPSPKAGVVRVHSTNKSEMLRIASIDPPAKEAAILFIGKTRHELGTLRLSRNDCLDLH